MTKTGKYLILGITFWLYHFTLPAQQGRIDSLEKILRNTKADTVRLHLYINLCYACDIKDNLKYAEPAVELSDRLLLQTRNYKERKSILIQKAVAYKCIAAFYSKQADTSKAPIYYSKVLEIYKEIYKGEEYIFPLMEMSNYYRELYNFPGAIEMIRQGLDIAKTLNDKKKIVSCLSFMAGLYEEQGELPQALSNFEKCSSVYKELKDTLGLANDLVKMAECYGKFS